MSRFSIKDLEQLSGIKAHTIRIWEQRYKIISPQRTKTNIRFYDDEALRLVLNIAMLNAHGFKISKIAAMSDAEMQQEIIQITENTTNHSDQIQAMTLAMIELNEDRFRELIGRSTSRIGFEETILKIIYPFLTHIGILWQTGAIIPAQEHFISNLIRQKIVSAIDREMGKIRPNPKKFMLFLPEGELHEISLLFSDFIIRSRQNKSIYLGQSLPFSDLESIYEHHAPDYLFTILTAKPGVFETQDYLNLLSEKFPNSTILISGSQVTGNGVSAPPNVKLLNSIQELIDIAERV